MISLGWNAIVFGQVKLRNIKWRGIKCLKLLSVYTSRLIRVSYQKIWEIAQYRTKWFRVKLDLGVTSVSGAETTKNTKDEWNSQEKSVWRHHCERWGTHSISVIRRRVVYSLVSSYCDKSPSLFRFISFQNALLIRCRSTITAHYIHTNWTGGNWVFIA